MVFEGFRFPGCLVIYGTECRVLRLNYSSISGQRLVTHDVPQGSILGPILFLVYINDLPNVSNSAHFTLFTDDTTISHSNNDYRILIDNVNSTEAGVFNWTVNNRLSLNAQKNFCDPVQQQTCCG